MFNAKWGIICGGPAFVFAFIISLLLGHTSLPVALIRGGGFAALFFCMGAGIWALVNVFIPELLAAQNDDVNNVFSKRATGARVNITLDDSDTVFSAALPDTGVGAAGDDEVGNFKDLLSRSTNSKRDIDQKPAAGYTEQEGQREQQEEFTSVFDSSLDASLGGSIENSLDGVKVDGLGDFSMDFGAFVPEGGKGGSDPLMDPFSFMPGTDDPMGAEEVSAPAAPQRSSSSGKTAELQGDFNPKDIAAGIRTVLEKDKKG
jgi:hypothetical protein